jgi:hypothetical protein
MYKQEKINPFADNLYWYFNFDQIVGFEDEGIFHGQDIPIEKSTIN